ncbi:hypothetical protein Tco_1325786, partial [Tanacetum coccineum]
DFTLDDVLDEVADDDGTIELPENFPAGHNPPHRKLANLKGVGKSVANLKGVGKAVVNSETRNDIHKEVFSFRAWKCCMKLGLEGVGGDDDVIFHF